MHCSLFGGNADVAKPDGTVLFSNDRSRHMSILSLLYKFSCVRFEFFPLFNIRKMNFPLLSKKNLMPMSMMSLPFVSSVNMCSVANCRIASYRTFNHLFLYATMSYPGMPQGHPLQQLRLHQSRTSGRSITQLEPGSGWPRP